MFYSLICFFLLHLIYFQEQKFGLCCLSLLPGKKIPRGVILQITFLYFFNILIILSSFISIWIGFNPRTTSKSCCALIIIVSIGSDIIPFFLFPSFFIEKWCIFLSPVFTSDPSLCASCNYKLFLKYFFSMRDFKKLFEVSNFRFVLAVFPEIQLKEPQRDNCLLMTVTKLFVNFR